jgi:hypothetical protein
MAKPIDELLPSMWEAALTAGVLNPLICGVKRGVGKRPKAGAKRPGTYVEGGLGSMTTGVERDLRAESKSPQGLALSGELHMAWIDTSRLRVLARSQGANSSRLSSEGVKFKMIR